MIFSLTLLTKLLTNFQQAANNKLLLLLWLFFFLGRIQIVARSFLFFLDYHSNMAAQDGALIIKWIILKLH